MSIEISIDIAKKEIIRSQKAIKIQEVLYDKKRRKHF